MTKENKQLVDVHLVDAGKDPIQVIDTLGIIKSQPSLNEAVDLVHGPPGGLILAGVNMSEAESALNELHEAGAVAEIKP